MRKPDPKSRERGGKAPHPKRGPNNAAAMREAVRKAIESLIDHKGPAKNHSR